MEMKRALTYLGLMFFGAAVFYWCIPYIPSAVLFGKRPVTVDQQFEDDYNATIGISDHPQPIGARIRCNGHIYVITSVRMLNGRAWVSDNRVWCYEHQGPTLETNNIIKVDLLPRADYPGITYELHGPQADVYQSHKPQSAM